MSVIAKKVLVDWANKQQNWVRTIVREVLATKSSLPQNSLHDIYQLFLAESKLLNKSFEEVPKLEFGDEESASIESFQLLSLYDLENVNKIAPKQKIDFNRGMTVVFGENATGKSGYIRVLKSLGAVRSKEVILPDIHKSTVGNSPSGNIKYLIGDKEKNLEWNGEEGIRPFNRLSIFDTRALSFHLDDDLTYV